MEGTYGQSDLWYVNILEDHTYGIPVNLGETINTEERETFPFISNKNNLYFSSDGHVGLGGLDVFVTNLNDDGSQWKFDTTFNWIGEQRYPNRIPENTTSIIPIYQAPTPDFTTVNAQLTRVFSEKFEVYLGVENLTNTKQKNPIVGSERFSESK